MKQQRDFNDVRLRLVKRPYYYDGKLIHNDYTLDSYVESTGKSFALYCIPGMTAQMRKYNFKWVRGVGCCGCFFSHDDDGASRLAEAAKLKMIKLEAEGKVT